MRPRSVFILILTIHYFIESESINPKVIKYLRPSLFDRFPPYLNFPVLKNCQKIPSEVKKFLYWPREFDSTWKIVHTSMTCADINLLSKNETIHNVFI